MCGIAGLFSKHAEVDLSAFKQALNTLTHRGPDGYGIKTLENGTICLGHRRLSIIDLSDNASQPMTNEDGTLWLTFNGEIYNYKTLRTTLQSRGHIFKTQSDSEVILHAFEEWGKDCVKKFRGIFAFAIYNTKNQSAFLARDHAGVKPLYYYYTDSLFAFASEPKAIIAMPDFRKEIDETALQLYLTYGNVPGEYSIYKGIKKLLPGHYLLYEQKSIKQIQRYWQLTYRPLITNEQKALEALNEKIKESVALQSVSDVPVGVLLSGGIDSTIVTGCLSNFLPDPISTFTIGFDDSHFNESPHAALVAEMYKTNHHFELVDAPKAFSFINSIIDTCDEPFHLTGLFSYFSASNLVKSRNYKVVMGGDGADELFAGYKWYDKIHRFYTKQKLPLFKKIIRWLQMVSGTPATNETLNYFLQFNTYLSPELQKSLTGKFNDTLALYPVQQYWNSKLPPVLAAQLADFNCFMVDHCLTKVDRMSMWHGIEVRVPFLDVELAEMAFSIDHAIMFKDVERKYILKKAGAEFFPPQMDTDRKKGFSSPVKKWLHAIPNQPKLEFLINGCLVERHLIDRYWLLKSLHHLSANDQLLLVTLELWARRWMENEKNPFKKEKFI